MHAVAPLFLSLQLFAWLRGYVFAQARWHSAYSSERTSATGRLTGFWHRAHNYLMTESKYSKAFEDLGLWVQGLGTKM